MSVRCERAGAVLTLVLDRPERKNALDDAMLDAFASGLDAAEGALDLRAVVLRATGSAFSAGGDLGGFRRALETSRSGGLDPVAATNRAFGRVLERLRALPVPTFALVGGAAAGGGVGLAAACDVVLASTVATFRLPETTLGIPPAQVLPFVADRIGEREALRLALFGETLSAADAARAGLVDRVLDGADALHANARELLHALGRAEPEAVRATKRVLAHDRVAASAARANVLDAASTAFAAALRGGRALEGLAALGDRRPPPWTQPLGDALEPLP